MAVTQHSLGEYGVWVGSSRTDIAALAAPVEQLGFGTLWVGGSPSADLTDVSGALEASSTLVVATGVVNIWRADAAELAASFRRIEQDHPGRLLLGVGTGHPERDQARRSPLGAMTEYLDVLDSEGVPAERRVISALGPRMLRLAAQRSRGSHPYLTVPEHTRWAREILGPDALLAPEVMVIEDTDPSSARDAGRTMLGPYLGLVNYTSTMERSGFTAADIGGGGSDRLVDSLTPWGTASQLAEALRAHTAAGANHVCAQVVPTSADPIPVLARVAGELGLHPAGR